MTTPNRTSADGPFRISSDVPGADLAYTRHVLSMDPGAPGLAASARSGCRAGQVQPCCNSNQVTVRPPLRRQPQLAASPATSPNPRPSSASPPQGRSCGTPRLPRSVTSTLTTPPAARTVTVTVSPAAPEPPCRTLFPNSSPAARHHPRHGCPGPSTPAVNARATRARSARPATVTLSRTTALATSAPAFPSRPRPEKPPRAAGGHTGMHARLSAARQAGKRRWRGPVRGRPWKSRRCAPTVLAPRTPSAYLHRRGDGKWFLVVPFTVWGRASLCFLALIAAGPCERAAGSGGAERPHGGAAGALDAAARERIMGRRGQGSELGSAVSGLAWGLSCRGPGDLLHDGTGGGEGTARLT